MTSKCSPNVVFHRTNASQSANPDQGAPKSEGITDSDFTDRIDVLAVGAHPDDVEAACGGTLAKLSAQGYRVGIVDLTDGEPTPHCPDVATRMSESKAAAQVLGIPIRIQMDLPNRELIDGISPRIELAKWIRRLRPSIVLGFGEKTPMASPDHWQAMQITDAAIFYARLSKWDDRCEGLPVHSVARHLYFRSPMEPDAMLGLSHHVTVDVSETIETKLSAIQCYHTQFDHKPGFLERVRAAALCTGSAASVAYGESFVAATPFAVDDLVTTVLGNAP